MKKTVATTVIFLIIFSLTFPALASSNKASAKEYERKIIMFEKKLGLKAQKRIVKSLGYHIEDLNLINGMVALVPAKLDKVLERIPGVLRVEDDIKVCISDLGSSVQPAQTLPWGVDRIDADLAWSKSEASGIKVAVMDTGIELTHPDLQANIKGGYNAIYPEIAPGDDNGHGTHIAGIIAAANNGIGVIGVARKADLYSVKVLDKNGDGFLSDVIKGIEWCIQNQIRVVNMSFGTNIYSEALRDAVKSAHDAGLVMVAAAGNNSRDLIGELQDAADIVFDIIGDVLGIRLNILGARSGAEYRASAISSYTNTGLAAASVGKKSGVSIAGPVDYPAKFDEVIAVAAIDRDGAVAPYSSRGKHVDIAAPGSEIHSTYLNDGYVSESGTSMATPHVSGAIALKLQLNPSLTPSLILDLLKRTAEPIPGATEAEVGAGLVDAQALVGTQ